MKTTDMALREQFAENFLAFNGMDEDAYSLNGMDQDVYASGTIGANEANPFVVTLTNTTSSDVSSVTFLDAANAIALAGSNYGLNAAITVSYGVSNVTYSQFLYSILTGAVVIGRTLLVSATSLQLDESLTISVQNVRGEGRFQTIKPYKTTMQQQTDRVDIAQQFTLNGFTKITLKIIANASVTFNFYPVAVSSTVSRLTGKEKTIYKTPSLSGGNATGALIV
jgi:hypothetical protein